MSTLQVVNGLSMRRYVKSMLNSDIIEKHIDSSLDIISHYLFCEYYIIHTMNISPSFKLQFIDGTVSKIQIIRHTFQKRFLKEGYWATSRNNHNAQEIHVTVV